jgi:hypothetical protein
VADACAVERMDLGPFGTPARITATSSPDVEDDPVLSADGRTLTILVGFAPAGDGPCEQRFAHEVVERDGSVTVAFDELPRTPLGEGGGCDDVLRPQRFDIELAAPLGDRAVYDGVRPDPQVVHRLADVVEVTTVPDGWAAEGPAVEAVRRHRRLYDAVAAGDLTATLVELDNHGARTYLAPELAP